MLKSATLQATMEEAFRILSWCFYSFCCCCCCWWWWFWCFCCRCCCRWCCCCRCCYCFCCCCCCCCCYCCCCCSWLVYMGDAAGTNEREEVGLVWRDKLCTSARRPPSAFAAVTTTAITISTCNPPMLYNLAAFMVQPIDQWKDV